MVEPSKASIYIGDIPTGESNTITIKVKEKKSKKKKISSESDESLMKDKSPRDRGNDNAVYIATSWLDKGAHRVVISGDMQDLEVVASQVCARITQSFMHDSPS